MRLGKKFMLLTGPREVVTACPARPPGGARDVRRQKAGVRGKPGLEPSAGFLQERPGGGG